MLEIGFAGAALAGLLSFLSPCILPMVPFYLSYMAGIGMSELREGERLGEGIQWRLFVCSVLFALGVTTIFVLLGLGATSVGQVFGMYRTELSYVAAAVLLVFGLHFLGVFRIPFLMREARLESGGNPATYLGAYLMGLAFGFGWTPCAGPALGAILMVAGGQDSLIRGGLLLFTYGAAMTAPFVLAALFARPFLAWFQRNRRLLAYAERAMGVLLVVFAALIATQSVNYIAQWMLEIAPDIGTLQ